MANVRTTSMTAGVAEFVPLSRCELSFTSHPNESLGLSARDRAQLPIPAYILDDDRMIASRSFSPTSR